MDYTVVGDGVNVAARLETANKAYGTRALVSGSTVALLRERYAMREIDLLRVKGRAQPVAIHELFASPPNERLLRCYAEGLAAYRHGDWTGAVAAFDAALRVSPGDAPSAVMRLRALDYAQRPPAGPWDGVFVDDAG
jgi:adenylate cyclase